jgi:hypothetical protein
MQAEVEEAMGEVNRNFLERLIRKAGRIKTSTGQNDELGEGGGVLQLGRLCWVRNIG